MTEAKRSKVEIRAFEIWEREGRPHGKAMEHWYQAVAEIAREEAQGAAVKVKKAASRKKTEKSKPVTRALKTASASTTKKRTKAEDKNKAASSSKAASTKKPKKPGK